MATDLSVSSYTLCPSTVPLKNIGSLRIAVSQVVTDDPAGAASLTPFSGVRLDQYAAGRRAAARALTALGIEKERIIPRAEDGSPVFPEGLIGSISHSTEIAVAVVGGSSSVEMLGIDLEPIKPVEESVLSYVAHKEEIEIVARHFSLEIAPLAIFVIKEAIYKAWWPKYRTPIWFSDVVISEEIVRNCYGATARCSRNKDTAVFEVNAQILENHLCALAIGGTGA